MSKNTWLLLFGAAAFYMYQQGTFSKVQGDITANNYSNLTTLELVAIAGGAIAVWELV